MNAIFWKSTKVTYYRNSFDHVKGDGFRGNVFWGFWPHDQSLITLRDSIEVLKPLNNIEAPRKRLQHKAFSDQR